MGYADNLAANQQRLLSNLPSASVAGFSVFNQLLQVFTSADANTQFLITSTGLQMSLATASGAGLVMKASDYGASPSLGNFATINAVFFLPSANAGGTIPIPVGTVIGTAGDGYVSQAINFATNAAAEIRTGATYASLVSDGTHTPVPLAATAVNPGTNGNVSPNTVTVMVLAIANGIVKVSNNTVVGSIVNPNGAGVGGTDADTDDQLRAKAQANILTKYGVVAVASALTALSSSGVYCAVIVDPQDGTATITYYWSDINGNQPGLSYGPPINYTNGSLAQLVNNTVRATLPPGVVPTPAALIVIPLTNVTIQYSCSSTIQNTQIEPIIQTAVLQYINGTVGTPFNANDINTGVGPGQVPTVFGMSQFVQGFTGIQGSLTFFNIISSTPAIGAVGATILYRATGSVTCVRV